jgi:acetyl-CoA acetyltransferase/uncharacterized OB-fold protein
MTSTEPRATRVLPAPDPLNDWFWHAGSEGRLRLRSRNGRVRHPSETPTGSDSSPAADVSGRGTVVAFTIVPDDAPGIPGPFCIAIVALAESPEVRLTTNIVNCPIDAVFVGMTVRVTFEQHGETWLPLFEPADGPAAPLPDPPEVSPPRPRSDARFESSSVVSGLGMSEVGRRLFRPPIDLATEAAKRAIDDAGLAVEDIDGICTYPGATPHGGLSEGGIAALVGALGLRPTYHNGGMEQPGAIGAVVNAMLAVHAGLCRHVLCVRTVWEATFQAWTRTGAIPAPDLQRATGDAAWRAPFGAIRPASWLAMNASLYQARFGLQRETLGRIAITARNHAALNPDAVYQDRLTMNDYLEARMISSPFGLYDCDVPCDGAIAFVVSAQDAATGLRQPPIRVEAVGTWIGEPISWDQSTLTHEPQVIGPAQHMWSRTDLEPSDVDVALLYDGFTFNCLSWLEALGFCDVGGAADFIGDGTPISLGGTLPINTHGGQLSAGRLHGFGGLHEAVLQLRGSAGARQVDGAQVAVVSSGGGTPGGCFLLTR